MLAVRIGIEDTCTFLCQLHLVDAHVQPFALDVSSARVIMIETAVQSMLSPGGTHTLYDC